MELKHEELEPIKRTKNVHMTGNKEEVVLDIGEGHDNYIYIPMRLVFQVKRGLESYIQKFYRRKK